MPDHIREPWHDEAYPPFEARPTTFRRVLAPLAAVALVAAVLAVVLMGGR